MASPTVTIGGEVVSVGELKRVGKKEVGTLQLVVDCGNAQWPNPVPIECYGDEQSGAAELLHEGDAVQVDCYVEGRQGTNQYAGRYFLKLKARTIKTMSSARSQSEPAPAAELPAQSATAPAAPQSANPNDDNLPF